MKNNKLLYYNLALMGFTGVWSFGNIINGFATYGGVRAIIPWMIIIALYFLPYSLMVGELGSAFPQCGSGVSSWIKETISPTAAYLAGWTYWIVHMPYISQKPSKIIVACGWMLFQDSRAQNLPTYIIAIISLVIFVAAIFMALRGISLLKKISGIAGMASFVLSILYIVMMFTAKAITGNSFGRAAQSISDFLPKIGPEFFLSLSILIFAVGGCERVSPYVNQMKDPGKDFPKGMIVMSMMVAVTALLGTIAMGMMFDSNNIPNDLLTNGGYYAFEMLGEHYGLGKGLVVVYAALELICQLAVIIISIDAPLKILLDNADHSFIPDSLFKKNSNGIYVNGVKLVAIIVSVLIILPVFGIGELNDLVIWLVKINSICMPLRYLWVFVAYIALKRQMQKKSMDVEYRFIKNPVWGKIVGGWCFTLTAAACIMGMYSENRFQLVMNIVLPICLIGLGFIMPFLARRK